MIGYHYSPFENAFSIRKHGLLVPTKHPKITTPAVCSEGHRNPHISLGRTPKQAWSLSGGFVFGMIARGDRERYFNVAEWWDLYEVELPVNTYRAYGIELQSRVDIPRRRVQLVGCRNLRE